MPQNFVLLCFYEIMWLANFGILSGKWFLKLDTLTQTNYFKKLWEDFTHEDFEVDRI